MSGATATANAGGTRSVTISELRVCDLKLELEKRGLDKVGVKFSLVERLEAALREEGHDPEAFLFSVGDTTKSASAAPRSSSRLSGPGGGSLPNDTKEGDDENGHEDSDAEEGRSPKRRKTSEKGKGDVNGDEYMDHHSEQPSIVESVKSEDMSTLAQRAGVDELPKKSSVGEEKKGVKEEEIGTKKEDGGAVVVGNGLKSGSGVDDAAKTGNEVEQAKQEPYIQKAQLVPTSRADASLWVKGIGNSTRATDLKTMCTKHGKVITAKIFTRRGQAKSTCFGFVTMASVSAAEECIREFNGSIFMGHTIILEKVDKSYMPPVRLAPKKPAGGTSTATVVEKSEEKPPTMATDSDSGTAKAATAEVTPTVAASVEEGESPAGKTNRSASPQKQAPDAKEESAEKTEKSTVEESGEKDSKKAVTPEKKSSSTSKTKRSLVVPPTPTKSEKTTTGTATDRKRTAVGTTVRSIRKNGNGTVIRSAGGGAAVRRASAFQSAARKPFAGVASGGIRRSTAFSSRGGRGGVFSSRGRGFTSSMSSRVGGYASVRGRGALGSSTTRSFMGGGSRGGGFSSRGGSFSARNTGIGLRGSASFGSRFDRRHSPPQSRFSSGRGGRMGGEMMLGSRRMLMEPQGGFRSGGAPVWGTSSRREMFETMRRQDEEFRIREEELKLQRERERLRYERERVERERIELEQLRMSALAAQQAQAAAAAPIYSSTSSRRSSEMYANMDPPSSMQRGSEARGSTGQSSRHMPESMMQGGRYDSRRDSARHDVHPRREAIPGRRIPARGGLGDHHVEHRSRSKRGSGRESHGYGPASLSRDTRSYTSDSAREMGSVHSRAVHTSTYSRAADQGDIIADSLYSNTSFGRESYRSGGDTGVAYSSGSRRGSESMGRSSRGGGSSYGATSVGYGRDSAALSKEVVGGHAHGRYSSGSGSGSRGMGGVGDSANPWASVPMQQSSASAADYMSTAGSSSGYASGAVWSTQSPPSSDIYQSRNVAWSGSSAGGGGYGSVGYEKPSKYEYDKYSSRRY